MMYMKRIITTLTVILVCSLSVVAQSDRRVQNKPYIDLVLGGHTHTYMEELMYENNMDGKPVPVDQNGKAAIFVGKLVVDLK